MRGTSHQDIGADSSSDREHVALLLTRLRAAERSLAEEIAEGLEISEDAAFVLARMRIEETISSSGGADAEGVREGSREEHYCARCWALLTPGMPCLAGSGAEPFEHCVYCGGPAS